MSGLRTLERDLRRIFSPAKKRSADPFRKQREEAKRVAKDCGIEIERDREGGMWVHCPKGVAPDPFEGDHYCCDWQEALPMVLEYQRLLAESAAK